jgi:nicotinate dehydrogenase subunit B
MFAAEERDAAYSGGEVEGWDAPPLNGSSMAPQGWSAEQLFNYLRRGGDEHHGVAAGPMKQVTHNLSQVAEADVRAIATYFAEEMAGATAPRAATDTAERQKLAAQAAPDGAAIFAGACAGCHDSDAPRVMAGRTSLAASTAVNAVSPRNTVQIVMHGVQPPEGERGAYMPGFATILTDAQVSDLVAYVRVRFSPQPAWRDLEPQVHDIRKGGDQE